MSGLSLTVDSGAAVEVRSFSVQEGLSSLFEINLSFVAADPALDLEAIVGRPASFGVISPATGKPVERRWDGVCSDVEQVHGEETGVSTYRMTLVPGLWLLGQRTNYRIFQHQSVQLIINAILAEWGITATWELQNSYLPLEYRTQYGETDLAFICRLLEEAGIAYLLRGPLGTQLVFSDAVNIGPLHSESPIRFHDSPYEANTIAYLTQLHLAHGVRPGAYSIRDTDFRRPAYALFGKAPPAAPPENRYEHYQYEPGGLQLEGQPGGATPVADDKAVARRNERYGNTRAEMRLAALREGKHNVFFETNVVDLQPATLLTVDRHPHDALAASVQLLMTDLRLRGTVNGPWQISGRARFAATPFRPPLQTSKPVVAGVQPAVVVGPPGEEIYVDEFGRVRVQFPWDREGTFDDNSSVWMRVSQSWAGTGYGFIQLPRVGQEVLIGFIQGDPDQPLVVGRVFNATEQVPYKLPLHKTRSTWKSHSSPTSGGFNEIMFEDLLGSELVYMQAEKNQRRLVKNDEMITVVNNRGKLVKANEVETTNLDRTEVVHQNRVAITDGDRTRHTAGNEAMLVGGNQVRLTQGSASETIQGTLDQVVLADTKRVVGGSLQQCVAGNHNTSVAGGSSLIVGTEHQLRVGMRHAVDAGHEIHLRAGVNLVVESGVDLTLKGPGGFIRIDPTGVTIVGNMVRINSGGVPGVGAGSMPLPATPATPAVVEPPAVPEPDDVSINGLAQ